MSATQITVTHTFVNPDGTPASGVIAFRLTARMTNGTTTYAPSVPVHATLNSSGQLSQVLPANNDRATTPAGSGYMMQFLLNGISGQGSIGDEVEIVVPYNAPGQTVDLGTLLPQQQGL